MTTPKVYIDSCCLIEVIKGRAKNYVEHLDEARAVEQILRAARNGEMAAFTSTLTIAEVLRAGNDPPTGDDKVLIERLLLSGRDGITLIEPTPFIAISARDLAWNVGLGGRAMDRLHVASALYIEAPELLTLDSRLASKFGASDVQGCRLVSAQNCTLLPDKYRTDDLLADLTEDEQEYSGPEAN